MGVRTCIGWAPPCKQSLTLPDVSDCLHHSCSCCAANVVAEAGAISAPRFHSSSHAPSHARPYDWAAWSRSTDAGGVGRPGSDRHHQHATSSNGRDHHGYVIRRRSRTRPDSARSRGREGKAAGHLVVRRLRRGRHHLADRRRAALRGDGPALRPEGARRGCWQRQRVARRRPPLVRRRRHRLRPLAARAGARACRGRAAGHAGPGG